VKQANVSTTRNKLSSILAEVKRGETYLIVDRNVPVARIEPIQASSEKLSSLVADGVVRMPERELDVDRFIGEPKPNLREGTSAVRVIGPQAGRPTGGD
jgi:prevent-host-death family protein